jgi:hypothetical protein
MAVLDDDNPYAAPKSEPLVRDRFFDVATEAWRDGQLMVVRKGAELLDRCLKCAAPTKSHRDRFSRNISWHRPGWFVLLFISWPLYLIVYFLVRQQALLTVGLCPLHRKKRSRAILLGWLFALAGVGAFIATGMLSDSGDMPQALGTILPILGLVLLLGGIFWGALGSQVLVPKRIDNHFVWLNKVSPEYLETLPDWNAPGDPAR